MWNPFDFDGDGSLDPLETAIGASIIGSYGYGAGASEAEERATYLRDEYKGKLDRKQRRIDELESELDNLRGSRYDNDDHFDYLNDDDKNFDDDDEYIGWSRHPYDYDEYYDEDGLFMGGDYDLDHDGRGLPDSYYERLSGSNKSSNLEEPESKQGTKSIKRPANLGDLATKGTYVAGLSYDGNDTAWLEALESGKIAVQVQRDPENEHDPNAIKVLVNDEQAGFIPARIALALAPLMDSGAKVFVVDYEIKTKTNSKDALKTKVNVQIYLDIGKDGRRIC